jgi:hypothetical protein
MVDYAKVRLWAERVRLVKRYLAQPGLWPGGIDTKCGRWYEGREDYWAGLAGNLDNVGKWAGGIDDDAAYKRFGLLAAPVREAADGPVSAAERMRRYRERQAAARRALEEAEPGAQ